MKQLLSRIDTKQDLTIYLANHTVTALEEINKPYVVTYDTISKTNIDDLPVDIMRHDHEEADTLLILHCWDIATSDPFTECVVHSPDTDVFLLLVHHFQSLPQCLIFRTGKGGTMRDLSIRNCYEALGSNQANALLGFHTNWI